MLKLAGLPIADREVIYAEEDDIDVRVGEDGIDVLDAARVSTCARITVSRFASAKKRLPSISTS
jgi:hypothetical protein